MADDDTKPSLLSVFWDLCPSSCGKGTILRLLEEFIASCVVVERFKHLDGDIEAQLGFKPHHGNEILCYSKQGIFI